MVLALGAESRRNAGLALRRASEAKRVLFVLEVPLERLAPSRGRVELSVIFRTAGEAKLVI